ncbi:MAG: MarR family transcriptional regulator [Actinomycetota bacterium]|nr:MarR family transcriptional regulator [Actinomycetota bacterium]MDQ2958376.1 MarR family transcriptional regulator [Actinomycetota bacterium]
MSQSFIRGLRLLETVDFHGPLSVSQLARRLQIDKATVSRMVAACEQDGWLARDAAGIRIGPRSAMLGQGAPAGESVRAAEPLVHAICGVTGQLTQAVGLVGAHCVALALAGPLGYQLPYGLTTRFPLWLSAGSKVVAAQLTETDLDRLLPADPFPAVAEVLAQLAPPAVLADFSDALGGSAEPVGASTLAADRAELADQLEQIRRDGVFVDRAELLPATSCVAVPWSRPGLAAGLVCIGPAGPITEHRQLIERTLRAAALPHADRESIVTAAAGR